ncbi:MULTISPECIES: hypothetical protein [unclassified Thiocapsa]
MRFLSSPHPTVPRSSAIAGLARGGAGLVIVEATAVSPEGRITPNRTGLWNDEQAQALMPAVEAIKAAGAVPGLRIGHAGRKANVSTTATTTIARRRRHRTVPRC